MHTNVIEKKISKQEYHAMIENRDSPFKKIIKKEFCYYGTECLYCLGLREIRVINLTAGNFPDCYVMEISINMSVFYGGKEYESFQCTGFDYQEFKKKLEQMLDSAIPSYSNVGDWRLKKIEYSKDLYLDRHTCVEKVLKTMNYIDGRKRMKFKIYKSGIEFAYYNKEEKAVIRFHFYRKIIEAVDKAGNGKANPLTAEDFKRMENLYRVELQIFSRRIYDLSVSMGIPQGSIEAFTDEQLEETFLMEILSQVYGKQPFRTRSQVVEIIENSKETLYIKKRMISVLDDINSLGYQEARKKCRGRRKDSFDILIKKIRGMGINLAYLPNEETEELFLLP